MGSGKTTLGRVLSRQLGYDFIDLDLFIENRYHKSIKALFAEHGDNGFREIERRILNEVCDFENTIIIFMSDNGGVSTSEGSPTCNYPLRAGKGFCYEGGIREPMIVYWPGNEPECHVSDTVVTSTDFYPTILDMLGLPQLPEEHLDGKSFKAALLEDTGFERGDIFWHYPHYSNQGSRPSGAVRSGDYKLIVHYDNEECELYNLKTDIGEQHDLADEMPELTSELKARFNAWLTEVGAQRVKKNAAYEAK